MAGYGLSLYFPPSSFLPPSSSFSSSFLLLAMTVGLTIVRLLTRFFFELVTVIVLLCFLFSFTLPQSAQSVTGVNPGGRPAPGGTYDNLVYFLQVSDVHLSVFHPERLLQFETFCNQTVKVISPRLVLLTGDITDALKNPTSTPYYQNQQQEAEWLQYSSTLVANGLYNKSFWLDIRGNHDAFAISDYQSPQNYYLTHGVYGDERDYTFVLDAGFARYQLVSMDLSFDLGVSAPFDFFGLVPQQISQVQAAVDLAPQFNHTLLFGHYPRVTSMNRVPWESLTQGKVLAYLCGHLHTARMYTVMPEDYQELELEVAPSAAALFHDDFIDRLISLSFLSFLFTYLFVPKLPVYGGHQDMKVSAPIMIPLHPHTPQLPLRVQRIQSFLSLEPPKVPDYGLGPRPVLISRLLPQHLAPDPHHQPEERPLLLQQGAP